MSGVRLPPTTRQRVIRALEDGAATCKEIADGLGLTRQRVDQVIRLELGSQKAWAYDKLRENLAARDGVVAFGETKMVADWAQDPRCTVTAQLIAQRMRHGWSAEDAISFAIGQPRPKPQIADADRERLLELCGKARRVTFNMAPDHPARLAAHERDELVRELVNQKITVKAIAEVVGVTRSAVHQWLNFTGYRREEGRYKTQD